MYKQKIPQLALFLLNVYSFLLLSTFGVMTHGLEPLTEAHFGNSFTFKINIYNKNWTFLIKCVASHYELKSILLNSKKIV